jgi:hypothetical protein
MLDLLSSLFNVAHATMETVVADTVSSTVGSLTSIFTTNLPVIAVLGAGIIGIFFVWRLIKRFVK